MLGRNPLQVETQFKVFCVDSENRFLACSVTLCTDFSVWRRHLCSHEGTFAKENVAAKLVLVFMLPTGLNACLNIHTYMRNGTSNDSLTMLVIGQHGFPLIVKFLAVTCHELNSVFT